MRRLVVVAVIAAAALSASFAQDETYEPAVVSDQEPTTQPAGDLPDTPPGAGAVEAPVEPAVQVFAPGHEYLLLYQGTVHTVFSDGHEQSLRQILVLPIVTGQADAEGNVPFTMSVREVATEAISNGESRGDYVTAPGQLASLGNNAAFETLTFTGSADRFNRVTSFQMAHRWVELGVVESGELDRHMHAVHDLIQSGFRGVVEAALAYVPPAEIAEGGTWTVTRPGFCPVAYMETGALRIEAHGWAELATCTLEFRDAGPAGVAHVGSVAISAFREPLYDPNEVGVAGDYTPMPTARASGLITEGAAGINLSASRAVYAESGDVRIEMTSTPMDAGDMEIVFEETIRLYRLRPERQPLPEDTDEDAQGGAPEEAGAQTAEPGVEQPAEEAE